MTDDLHHTQFFSVHFKLNFSGNQRVALTHLKCDLRERRSAFVNICGQIQTRKQACDFEKKLIKPQTHTDQICAKLRIHCL